MIHVSPVTSLPPESYQSPLQQLIYTTLTEHNIPFRRVSNDPSHTMEEAVYINRALGGRMAKNLLLTNRQQNKFWLLVMAADKPFVTRDFSAALNIPRVSFAPAECLERLLGVEYGAANILCTLSDPACSYTLVIDRQVLEDETFMCPDGTTTGHIRISTDDLLNRILPLTAHTPLLIDL